MATKRRLQRTVSIIAFYDDQHRILLQDRHGIAKSGEEWGFFGGGVEPGETPKQAVIRETKEELDYDLRNPYFLGPVEITLNDEMYVRGYVFVHPLGGLLQQFDQREGRDMRIFTLDEAHQLKIVPGDHDVLDRLADYFRQLNK